MYHIHPHTWRRGARNTVAFPTCIFLTVLPLQIRKRLTYTPSPRVALVQHDISESRSQAMPAGQSPVPYILQQPSQNAIHQGERLHTVCPHAVRPSSASRMPASEATRDPDRCDAGFCGCLTKTFESTASSHSSLNTDLLLPLISAEFQDFCLFHAPELGRGLALLGGTRSCYCSPSNKLLVLAYRGD